MKTYHLETTTIQSLGVAADDAFLIEGPLNIKYLPEDITDENKHLPVGPEMQYIMDDANVNHTKECVTVLLFIPSIA